MDVPTHTHTYIYYIHPKLRIQNCRFGSGKGAGPLLEERRGSKGERRGSKREHRGSKREHRGSKREHQGSRGEHRRSKRDQEGARGSIIGQCRDTTDRSLK